MARPGVRDTAELSAGRAGYAGSPVITVRFTIGGQRFHQAISLHNP
jgi:hypothetical protein